MTEQLRRVRLEFGLLEEATGSVQLELGGTKVLCAVTGPAVPARSSSFNDTGTLKCEVRFAPWTAIGGLDAVAGKVASQNELTATERQLSCEVYDAILPSVRLEGYQKAVITVHVMVLQSMGGELAASITAASMALSDAGIELNDLVCACTVVECGAETVLDPESTAALREKKTGSLVLAKLMETNKVTQVVQCGSKTAAKLDEMVELADKGCDSMTKVLKEFLRRKMT